MARPRAVIGVLVVAVGLGCDRGRARETRGATTTATAITTATATATTTARAVRGCESQMQRGAITLRGASGDAPKPLSQGDAIAAGSLVDVPNGAELTVRTASHREITVTGPASASVCPGGDDEIILFHGKLSAFPGTGVRPGAEVWVSTPLGVVRYGAAKIDMEVATLGDRLAVTVALARADFAPGPSTRIEQGASNDAAVPPTPFVDVAIPAGTTLVAVRASAQARSLVADLVAACTRESRAVEQALRGLAAAPASATDLGDRAAAHVTARHRARAACEMARAAGGLPPSGLDARFLVELDAADEKRNQLTPLPARR